MPMQAAGADDLERAGLDDVDAAGLHFVTAERVRGFLLCVRTIALQSLRALLCF